MSNNDALKTMVNEDRQVMQEQKGFESRLELAAPPEVAMLQILNFVKLVGRDREKSGWVDWTKDIGKKMQDFAGMLMEKIGPSERDAIAIETDSNLVHTDVGIITTLKAIKESGGDYSSSELVNWQDDFGYLGTIVHNEYGRMQDAVGADRKIQEFKCQRIVKRGIGVLADVMNILPEDMEAVIEVDSNLIEALGVEPDLLRKTDNPDVSKIIVPRHNVLKDETSLWFPIGPGDKTKGGFTYVQLTPDKWSGIGFKTKE